MSDESRLEIRPKDGDSSLSPSKVQTGLIARGRRDAAMLTAPVRAGSDGQRISFHLWVALSDGRTRDEVFKDGEKGDAKGQNLLACTHRLSGKDPVEAAMWYRRAADQGLKEAQFNLGVMYDNGEGVVRDRTGAAEWYRKAADQGLKEARFNLGVMYDTGEGVVQNCAEAAKWYRKAAEQGIMDPSFRTTQ